MIGSNHAAPRTDVHLVAATPRGYNCAMQVTIDIPADLLDQPDPAREAIEAIAIAAYRSGAMTAYEARTLLGFESRFQFHDFLMQHGVIEHQYDTNALLHDVRDMDLRDTDR
jgi:predicted HTH domain antitoxin